MQSLANITLELNETNPSDLCETFWTATFKLDLGLATYIVNEFMSEIILIKNARVSSLTPCRK